MEEWNKNLLIVLGITFIVIPAVFTTVEYNGVTAEDWNRHGPWIDRYIRGDLTSFFEYPPFFHLFMIPWVLLMGSHIKYFQIVIAIMCALAFAWSGIKLEGKFGAAIILFALFSSFSILQQTSALQPEPFDFIIFSIITVMFFEKRYGWTALGLLMLMHNHLFGILYLGAFGIYSLLFEREFLKYIMLVLIISIPTLTTFYYDRYIEFQNPIITMGNFSSDRRLTNQIWDDPWARNFEVPIWNYVFYSGLVVWALLPDVIVQMRKQKKFTRQQAFYAICSACFVPVIYFQLWRATPYILIPFVFFEASVLRRADND